jgi:hypothetical protein
MSSTETTMTRTDTQTGFPLYGPALEIVGRPFTCKFAGKCAFSGLRMETFHQARMVSIGGEKPRAVRADVLSEVGGTFENPHARALRPVDFDVAAAIAFLKSGGELTIQHKSSKKTKIEQRDYLKGSGKFNTGTGTKTEKQVLRLLSQAVYVFVRRPYRD